MTSPRERILECRVEDRSIIERDLRLLKRLAPDDVKILKQVNTVRPYRRRRFIPAVLQDVKGIVDPDEAKREYKRIMDRLLRLQADHPDVDGWLDPRYSTPEAIAEELRRTNRFHAKLVDGRHFAELLAAYHHKTKRRPSRKQGGVKHRRQEKRIIERGGLELLTELEPEGAEILLRMHGLGGYEKAESMVDAIRYVKEKGNQCYYFTPMSKLVWLQAERRLYKPSRTKKETLRDLEKANLTKNGSERKGKLGPAKLAMLCEWNLLYDAYCHGIFVPEQSTYELFVQSLIQYSEGKRVYALREEHPVLYRRIGKKIGLARCDFLHELFLEFLVNDKMPPETRASWIFSLYPKMRKYCRIGSYDALRKEWEPIFERVRLLPQQRGRLIACYLGTPKQTADMIAKVAGGASKRAVFDLACAWS